MVILEQTYLLQSLQSAHKKIDLAKISQLFLKELGQLDNQINQLKAQEESYKQSKQQITYLIHKQPEIEKFQFYKDFLKLHADLEPNNSKKDDTLFQNALSQYYQEQQNNQIENLYGKFSFQDHDQSNQIEVKDNPSQNKISIYKKYSTLKGSVYFKYELNQGEKYIVRFKFNDFGGDWITLGLINSQNLYDSLSITCQGKCFGQKNLNYGGFIVEGDYFYQIINNLIVELRIDIQEKQIQFLNSLNFSKFISINQLQEKYELDSNGKYYLAINYGQVDSSFDSNIDIIYFKEVENA